MRNSNRFGHLRHDERGISNMLIGFGMFGFMAATTLALDVGMFMAARTQAQASADAGALSGAVALVFNDYDDRSATGPAVTSAVSAAAANQVMHGDVSVGPEDVTFPLGPTGLDNRVHVFIERDVPTVLGWIFGMTEVNIVAAATGEASPADAATCLLPFTLPDRWQENTEPQWTPESTFDMYDKKGNPLNPRDVYTPGTSGTGYDAERDKGTVLILKTNNDNKVSPSIYNPWRLPGSDGADDYREAISGCNTNIIETGDRMEAEPGNMTGPTRQGFDDLVAQDPGAYWDGGCNCIKGSRFAISPRLRTIPLYDPVQYENGKQTGSNATLVNTSFLGVFVERMQGGEIFARIHPVTALVTGNGNTESSFAMAIRLVE